MNRLKDQQSKLTRNKNVITKYILTLATTKTFDSQLSIKIATYIPKGY